jgi:two-component system, LytTR family, response regulator
MDARLSAIIVDDELRSVENLSSIISNHFSHIDIIGIAHSVPEALKLLSHKQPDVLFLDIDMPPFTGFDLLRQLAQITCQIVFVTAYDFYAIEAIKFSASYYILKPIQIEEVRAAVSRIVPNRALEDRATAHFFKELPNNIDKLRHIVINSHRQTTLVELPSILYIEASNVYSIFHLEDGTQVVCSQKGIGEYEEMLLEHSFFRIHKSYLVNTTTIAHVDKMDGAEVVLKSGQRLPLAVRRKEAFFAALNNVRK